jgi:hypothetical protein
MNMKESNPYRIFVGKAECRRLLGETGFGGMDWIDVT